MKAASIALAAILALSSTAFAAEDLKQHPVKSTDKPVSQEQVDTTTTGSIQSQPKDSAKKPRLGMDLNPFSFGNFH